MKEIKFALIRGTQYLIQIIKYCVPLIRVPLILLGTVMISATLARADITTGLIGHWAFDENSGNIAADSSNVHTGTLQGAGGLPQWSAGKIKGALLFDGVDDYMTASAASFPTGNASRTVAGWIKSNNRSQSGVIFSYGSGSYTFYVSFGGGSGRVSTSEGSSFSVSNSTNLADDQWHHFVIVHDSIGPTQRVYVDGQQVATGTNTYTTSSYATAHMGNRAALNRNFSGSMDDLRIYNRALSAADITELYAYGFGQEPVQPSVNQSPVARLSADVTSGTSPVTVNFNANTSTDADGSIVNYTWNFGDGDSASSSAASHTYASAGTYQVVLTVRDNQGATATASTTITVSSTVMPPATGRVDLLNTSPSNSLIRTYTGTGAIQNCANDIQEGQTCLVYPDRYDERVSITGSSASVRLARTFKANGSGVVVRGFSISSASDVIIDGFEITNQDMSVDNSFNIVVSGSTRVQILNNNIHHTRAGFIQTGNSSFVTIRGNTGTYADFWNANKDAQGRQTRNTRPAYSGTFGQPDSDILIEENTFSNVGDFTNPYGTRFVIRNNIFGPSQDEVTDHIDGIQANGLTTDSLVEGNLSIDNHNSDNHFLLNQTAGSDRWIIRYNVVHRSKGGQDWRNVNSYHFYHNTFYDTYNYYPSGFQILLTNSTGNTARNNIWYRSVTPNGNPYSVGLGSSLDKDYDLWFNSGNPQEINALNADPLFTDTASGNFNLANGSAAINRGGPLTMTTNAAATPSTTLQVANAAIFQPGWAGVQADWIALCPSSGCNEYNLNSQTAQIASINTNTITLRTPLTWASGYHVYLFKDSTGRQVLYGNKPDIGAYEYNIPSSAPLTISVIANQTGINAMPRETIRTIHFTITDMQTPSGPFTATVTSSSSAIAASVSITGNTGVVTLTSSYNQSILEASPATITLTVSDPSGASVVQTFQATINDPPNALSRQINMLKNMSWTAFLGSDAENGGVGVTRQILTQPSNGTLTPNADGTHTYRPNTDYVGIDSYRIRVSDGTFTRDFTVPIMIKDISLSPLPAAVRTIYVSPNGPVDANNYRTLTAAVNAVTDQDLAAGNVVILVGDGVYEEQVTVPRGGRDNNHRLFIQANGKALVRAFRITGVDYITIQGFEITHNTTAYSSGFYITDTNHIHILNNTIHHTNSVGITAGRTGNPASPLLNSSGNIVTPANYTVIKGNVISYSGVIALANRGAGEAGIATWGSYNLIESNDISHVGDFTNVFGHHNVIRNNYFHEVEDADFPDHADGPGGHHLDGLQYYSTFGVDHEETLTTFDVLTGARANGNVTVTFNGESVHIPVTTADDQRVEVADKIRSATYSGGWRPMGQMDWGTTSIRFSNTSLVSGQTASFSAGSTGVVANLPIYRENGVARTTLVINSGASVSGNLTVTLSGGAVNVAVAAADTASQVAAKIRAAAYTEGWSASGSGDTVNFQNSSAISNWTVSFNAASTGVISTINTVPMRGWWMTPEPLNYTVYEKNLIFDAGIPHAHGMILRDTAGHGSREFLMRNNTVINIGGGPGSANPFIALRYVNNTFVNMANSWYGTGFDNQQASLYRDSGRSTDGKVINNIFYNTAQNGGGMYYVEPLSSSGFRGDYNLGYRSGYSGNWRTPGGVSYGANDRINVDPLFEDPVYSDHIYSFALQESSPAIDTGGFLTQTASSGSGTQMRVADAGFFFDGFGIAGLQGDEIQLENQSQTARILSIDYASNTLTLDRALTWSAGQGVSYKYHGTRPDIGAHEYGTVSPQPAPTPDPAPPILLGDVSNDGKVTMYDAALVLRYTLGAALSDVQKQKADMNADGKIDGSDVLAIGRKALGL